MRPFHVLARIGLLALAGSALLGCAASPPAPLVRPHIGAGPIHVAALADETEGALPVTLAARIREEVREALVELGRADMKRKRPPLVVSETPGPGIVLLEVRVLRFDPEGSTPAALLGFGAGRPGWALEARLVSGTATLDERSFERISSGYAAGPVAPAAPSDVTPTALGAATSLPATAPIDVTTTAGSAGPPKTPPPRPPARPRTGPEALAHDMAVAITAFARRRR